MVPPPDIDSVSEISDERFSSVVEDEPSGKKGKSQHFLTMRNDSLKNILKFQVVKVGTHYATGQKDRSLRQPASCALLRRHSAETLRLLGAHYGMLSRKSKITRGFLEARI